MAAAIRRIKQLRVRPVSRGFLARAALHFQGASVFRATLYAFELMHHAVLALPHAGGTPAQLAAHAHGVHFTGKCDAEHPRRQVEGVR